MILDMVSLIMLRDHLLKYVHQYLKITPDFGVLAKMLNCIWWSSNLVALEYVAYTSIVITPKPTPIGIGRTC